MMMDDVDYDDSVFSMIARLMRVNYLAKTKRIRKLRLSRWKTIEIMKVIRFQSSNLNSKLKGYLLQTTKLWEELVVPPEKEKKPQLKPREEVNVSLKMVGEFSLVCCTRGEDMGENNLRVCEEVGFRH